MTKTEFDELEVGDKIVYYLRHSGELRWIGRVVEVKEDFVCFAWTDVDAPTRHQKGHWYSFGALKTQEDSYCVEISTQSSL